MAKSIMIQGAGSNVGKSVLVAGLCRLLTRRGFSVRPFKPQNMSNNAAVAIGGEIGRAQALQALACGVEPHVDMNPVLLKPESETGAQVIVQGKRKTTVRAREYAALKPELMTPVLESFERLGQDVDLIIVEGAGSPAEVNLREGDIANMGFALAAKVPVILVGDIDRGGVIAQMVGTNAVLDPRDRALIQGFIINKFRGDVSLFDEGRQVIEKATNWPDLGVVPWFAEAGKLPAEDALDIPRMAGSGATKIAVLQLNRIANFDDLDPLTQAKGLRVEMVRRGSAIPGDADLVLIPGSKSTIADLADLRAQGWDVDIMAHLNRGGHVLGICGGYQMLGKRIEDPDGIEGAKGGVDGLGLLDITTIMTPDKTVREVSGKAFGDVPIQGYEIHIGQTTGPDLARSWISIDGRQEGAANMSGTVRGCYLHGMFSEPDFLNAYFEKLGAKDVSAVEYDTIVDQTLNALADHLETFIDVDKLVEISNLKLA